MEKSLRSPQYRLFMRQMVEARKAAGLTQRQLAAKLDCPPSFVAKYELGERRLDIVEFLAVTRAIGADPNAILNAVNKLDTVKKTEK